MKRLIFIIILLPAFIIGASADLDAAARDAGIYGVEDSLTDDARDISGKLDITGGYDTGSALGRLWRRFLDYLVEQLRGSVGDIAGLTAISVFCAMAASLVTDKRLPEYINMAACCAAGVLRDTDGGCHNKAFRLFPRRDARRVHRSCRLRGSHILHGKIRRRLSCDGCDDKRGKQIHNPAHICLSGREFQLRAL